MKVQCAIFAFCVVLWSSAEAHSELFQKVIDKCIETTGVDGSKFILLSFFHSGSVNGIYGPLGSIKNLKLKFRGVSW